ncbi:RNA 2',3'-cyclic phosphodiesterase [Candidatus Woesearchaeota archaeon]|nr:RNA 2',3'-cyclic phosphodiesterase [Candidatus Woesearchaeota archaeon]
MRLFIAIAIPETGPITEGANTLKIQGVSVNKNPHITLKFLGEGEPEHIIGALGKVKVKGFNAETAEIGYFPGANKPRVIWLGLEPKEQFLELHKKIDIALESMFPKDKKFKPHITLARVATPADIKELRDRIVLLQIPKIKFEVTKFYLMKSTLSPKGAVHEVVKEFGLD